MVLGESIELGQYKVGNISSFGQLVSLVLNNAFILAGIVCLILLVFGGVGVIMGAGGDAKKLESAKKTITAAIIGLILVIASYWIVQIIGFITGAPLLEYQTN